MTDVRETNLPGVGIRYEFTTSDGRRLGVVHHRTGRRELVVYDRDDPDTARETVRLNEDESRTLAEMLGGAGVADELERLRQSIEGLSIDWLPVVPETPYVERTIGDTRARTRTGASIVAVIRDEGTVPAPGPDFKIEAGDTLVVVGTDRGIEDLAVLLRTG